MWNDTSRMQYGRPELGLQSELTDAEWAELEPFFRRSTVGRCVNAHCGGLDTSKYWPFRHGGDASGLMAAFGA